MIHPAAEGLIHILKAAALTMLAQHRTPEELLRRQKARAQKR
jgi:hypothetical protein